VAASAWVAQTYPERELVVVNATGRALPGGLPEGAVEVRAEPGTPGRLRNLGCDAATGEWLAQWDDDDWSAPDRLTVQMAQRREGACCLLRRQARYDVTPDSRRGGLVDAPAGAGGTLLLVGLLALTLRKKKA
jgi:glycosyltransferase involved in cell wall biosynthesis